MAALSLTCKQCNAQLKSVKEAQDHGEVTGHSQFEESTEPVSVYTAMFEILARANLNLDGAVGAKPAMHHLW